MMMLAQAVRKEWHADSANKETETVRTADSSDDDDSECGYSEGSLEEIDLLVLGDDNDDYYPSFYYDDDVDLLERPVYKNNCIQRALSGFTGMLHAFVSSDPEATDANANLPMNVVMTDTFLMAECFAR